MTDFNAGDTVTYIDDRTNTKQKVRLEEQTTEPDWATNPVWLFTVLEDGPLFKQGEQSYARDSDLQHTTA